MDCNKDSSMLLLQKKNRSLKLDILKSIAIIAVVLYHFGGNYVPFGYLGVEVFFVISGYLMMLGILKSMKAGTFRYFNYLINRIVRLAPLVLVLAGISWVIGFNYMLPDDFENLGESVFATAIFSNNILACITTKNYWDVVNTFKPLMHTWYIGILMQAYVLLPLIYMISNKTSKNSIKALKRLVYFITFASILAYTLPFVSDAQKFYYLPFRLFEITIGSLLAFYTKKISEDSKYINLSKYINIISIILLLTILFYKGLNVPGEIKLLVTVFITGVLIATGDNLAENKSSFFRAFSQIGKYSLSIYLCHQIIIAFMYYSFVSKPSISVLFSFIIVVIIISLVTIFMLEKPLDKLSKVHPKITLSSSILLAGILCFLGGYTYLKAGVIHDVPELGITTQNAYRGMHAEYCDRPYAWNKDFSNDSRKKILVIGNSFGRDWANILNESKYRSEIEISYLYSPKQKDLDKIRERIKEADIVFCALGPSYQDIPEYYNEYIPKDKLYIVGNKNFGPSNGIIYAKRGEKDYFLQTVELEDELITTNKIYEIKYGEKYINLISAVQDSNEEVKVFTDDGYFISQDCRHLTKFGAKYFAKILDLSWIIK